VHDPRLDCRDDVVADFILELEGVLEAPVVALRPDVAVGQRVDQLHGHAHAVTRLAHAALDDVPARQLAGDGARVDTAALVGVGRLSRNDPQARRGLQPREQIFDDAVRQIALLRLSGQVGEGKHRDAVGGGARLGGVAQATPGAHDVENPGEH
jgi:hypothetical protein